MTELPVALLVAGYGGALHRFAAAQESRGPVAVDRAYMGLFEALNWAVALDDRLEREWPGERGKGEQWSDAFAEGRTLRGVRHARNRVHHQWADALVPPPRPRPPTRRLPPGYEPPLLRHRPPPPKPAPYVPSLPRDISAPFWHWAERLPSGRPKPTGEECYAERPRWIRSASFCRARRCMRATVGSDGRRAGHPAQH